MSYRLIEMPMPGIARLEYNGIIQVWSVSRLRKFAKCQILGVEIYGGRAFRPLTNLTNRGDRISIEGMDYLRRKTEKENAT